MITIKQQGDRIDYNYKELYCDTKADLDSIDFKDKKFKNICAGSIAYIVNENSLYILNSNHEWKLLHIAGSESAAAAIESIKMNENNHLIFTMTDGTTIDAGEVSAYVPQKGIDYFTDEDKAELTEEIAAQLNESLTLDTI